MARSALGPHFDCRSPRASSSLPRSTIDRNVACLLSAPGEPAPPTPWATASEILAHHQRPRKMIFPLNNPVDTSASHGPASLEFCALTEIERQQAGYPDQCPHPAEADIGQKKAASPFDPTLGTRRLCTQCSVPIGSGNLLSLTVTQTLQTPAAPDIGCIRGCHNACTGLS